MKRRLLWLTLAAIPLAVVARLSIGTMTPAASLPEVSLGVMKSCAHLGALTRRIALDREEGLTLDDTRYRRYQAYLRNRQTLFRSPDFAILLAYRSRELKPETLENLGVQTCIAAYYGFREPTHHDALYQEALSCQQGSKREAEFLPALNDCMGREYQRLVQRWWAAADPGGRDEPGLLASSGPP